MMKQLISALLGLYLATLSPGVSAGPITVEMRREDPRLEKPVTLSSTHISIGEAAKKLSSQTGVPIATEERDSASGEPIVMLLRGEALADAMNAVWSLVSYRDATWEWVREGERGRYRYALIRPLAARRLAANLGRWIQDAYERQAELLMEAAALDPDMRAAFVRGHTDEISPTNPGAVEQELKSQRTWDGLAVFQECLAPAERIRILRGGETGQIPVSSLSERGKAFVQSTWSSMNAFRGTGAARQRVPPPASVRFRTSSSGDRAAPTLVIDIEGIGAYGYAGGYPVDAAFMAMLEARWLVEGDSRDSEVASKVFAPPQPAESPVGAGDSPTAKERRCRELSDQASISLLARLPADTTSDPGPPQGKTVKEYLTLLRRRDRMMSKWRGNVLLLSTTTWYRDEASRVSQDVVDRLRTAARAAGGLLPLDQLAPTAASLSPDQMKSLAREFPELASASTFREVFAAASSSALTMRQALSSSGVALTDKMRGALSASPVLGPKLSEAEWRALRFRQSDTTVGGRLQRDIVVELMTPERQWRPVAGYLLKAPDRH